MSAAENGWRQLDLNGIGENRQTALIHTQEYEEEDNCQKTDTGHEV